MRLKENQNISNINTMHTHIYYILSHNTYTDQYTHASTHTLTIFRHHTRITCFFAFLIIKINLSLYIFMTEQSKYVFVSIFVYRFYRRQKYISQVTIQYNTLVLR